MSIRSQNNLPIGIVKDEIVDDHRLIILTPYIPLTVLLVGYVLTGLIFGVIGVFVLILVGIGALISEDFSLLSLVFFFLMLGLSVLLHFYAVKPAKRALRPYVRLLFYREYLIIEQIFPDVARFSPITVPYPSIQKIDVFEANSLGYRVGIVCDESLFPRTHGIIFLGSFGDKKNASKVKNYLQSVVSKYRQVT